MPRVRRVVTSRRGGVSRAPYDSLNLSPRVGDDPVAVSANRDRVAAATGVPAGRFVWTGSVHGREVATIVAADLFDAADPADRSGPVTVPGVDGLVTDEPGVVLGVLSADCVPVLAADHRHGVAGVAHAGWRGSAAGVVDALVASMAGVGADPADTDVLLGPAVCGDCYEVGEDTFSAVTAALPASAYTTVGGRPALDLRAGLRARLLELGVRHVVIDSRCTREDRDCFSHRRDGVTGRQAGLAWVVGGDD